MKTHAAKLFTSSNQVYLLTKSGSLYVRCGITKANPEGNEWKFVYTDVRCVCPLPNTTSSNSHHALVVFSGKIGSTKHLASGMLAEWKFSKDRPNEPKWTYGIDGTFVAINAVTVKNIPPAADSTTTNDSFFS